MNSPQLSVLPAPLSWTNLPLAYEAEAEDQLHITAGPETDWFIDPAGHKAKNNAPVALFSPPDESFLLTAKLTVRFAATYDAGVLFIHHQDDHWAKLCFEYSPQHRPTIVSVVTRGASDDCNSVSLVQDVVYLRLYRHRGAFAFHYSVDGHYWSLVRYFTLGPLGTFRVGFSAQSPTGAGCTVRFSAIKYWPGTLQDLRNGT